MRLKTNGTWMVDLTEDGYEIRPFGKSGAKVVVARDGQISVSSSSKLVISVEDWKRLSKEIEEGVAYMKKNPTVPTKEKKIKQSEIVGMSFYRDDKDRGVFELGTAKIIENTHGFSMNRSGCPYVTGYIDSFKNVSSIKSRYFENELQIYIDTNSGEDYYLKNMEFDSRARKNSGLVEKLWSLNKNVLAGQRIVVHVNGREELVCERIGNPYIPNRGDETGSYSRNPSEFFMGYDK